MRGVHEVLDEEQREEDGEEDTGEVGVAGDALEARRAADIVDVDEHDADDLAKAQGRDGEVVAAKAQRRQADEDAEESRSDGTCEKRDGKRHVEVRRQDGGDVGADRHEASVPERELSRIAVDEVEARRQDDVDAEEEEVQLPEGADDAPRDQPLQDAEEDEPEEEEDEVLLA